MTQDHAVVLRPPEGDSTIAIVDVVEPEADASSADDAVAQGWAAVRPGFGRKLKLVTPTRAERLAGRPRPRVRDVAEREGGGVRRRPPLDRRRQQGLERASGRCRRRHHGEAGRSAVAEFTSLRPRGYVRENLAGRTPHPLDAERIAVLRRFVADGMRQLDVRGSA